MFNLARDSDGTLTLRHEGRAVPVWEAYLRELCVQKGIILAPGETRTVDDAFVREAVEQALEMVSADIHAAIDLCDQLRAAYAAVDGRSTAA